MLQNQKEVYHFRPEKKQEILVQNTFGWRPALVLDVIRIHVLEKEGTNGRAGIRRGNSEIIPFSLNQLK